MVEAATPSGRIPRVHFCEVYQPKYGSDAVVQFAHELLRFVETLGAVQEIIAQEDIRRREMGIDEEQH
jgi:hypothetical protein